ncbi:hypothetical protein ACFX1X_001135 [Malus domestica]
MRHTVAVGVIKGVEKKDPSGAKMTESAAKMKRIVRFEGSQSEVYGCNNKAWVVATSVCSWYLRRNVVKPYTRRGPMKMVKSIEKRSKR